MQSINLCHSCRDSTNIVLYLIHSSCDYLMLSKKLNLFTTSKLTATGCDTSTRLFIIRYNLIVLICIFLTFSTGAHHRTRLINRSLSVWCLFVLDYLWNAVVCFQPPSLLIGKVWEPVMHFCACPIHWTVFVWVWHCSSSIYVSSVHAE